jgi:hypothetical protein
LKGTSSKFRILSCQSQAPVIFPLERFHRHFLRFGSYQPPLTAAVYLSRDSIGLRARSYFVASKTFALWSGFLSYPVLFVHNPAVVLA